MVYKNDIKVGKKIFATNWPAHYINVVSFRVKEKILNNTI